MAVWFRRVRGTPWKCWHLRSSTRQKTENTAKTAANRGSHAVACNGFSQVFSSRQKGRISPKIYPFFTSPMAIVDFWTNKYRLDSLFGIQLFLCHFGVDYLRPNFATVFGLLFWFWFWGEGVGELLGYLGFGDSDDVC